MNKVTQEQVDTGKFYVGALNGLCEGVYPQAGDCREHGRPWPGSAR